MKEIAKNEINNLVNVGVEDNRMEDVGFYKDEYENYIDWTDSYSSTDDNLNTIKDKINDLFISVRYKYIKQNEDGNYTTYNKLKNPNHVYLNDGFIKSHLLRTSTYGVFCRSTHSKFITFDVDIPDLAEAKRVVLALYDSLNSLGIPSNKIFTSWSGTKGFHVDIYFSEEIPFNSMKKFYNATLLEVSLVLDKKIGEKEIELRPTPGQGVKLPLSINLKNKDKNSNVCWYVDVQNNFAPIRQLEYILNIEPINAKFVIDLIKNLSNMTNNKQLIKKEVKKDLSDEINNNQPTNDELKNLSNLDLSNESPNSIAALYENGLNKSSIRNDSLCKLAIYFNTLKVTKTECEQRLRRWMDKQDTKYYKTPLEICYKEITRIVKLVYKNNIVLSNGKTEVVISRSEMLTIYQYPKNLHQTITSLLIHSKRFGNNNGEFYMTYEQIAVASKCSVKTAINHINTLEKDNLIKVTRTPKEHLPENYPNTYVLNLNWLQSDIETSVKVIADKIESYFNIRTTLIQKTFPNNEWWNISDIVNKALKEQERILK